MSNSLLKPYLEPILRRQRWRRTWWTLTVCWILACLTGLMCWSQIRAVGELPGWVLPALLGASIIACVAIFVYSRRWTPDLRQVARRIEGEHPELHAVLITAVEQQPDTRTGRFSYLQQRVVDDAIFAAERTPWTRHVSPRQVAVAEAAHWVSLIAFLAVVVLLQMPSAPVRTKGASSKPDAKAATITAQLGKVDPGNTEVERGTPLTVLAHFKKLAPSQATLVILPQNGRPLHRELARNLDDPIYGATLTRVDQPFRYRVEYDGKRSSEYTVGVYEHPTLETADAKLTYPAYTKLPANTVKDTRRLSAVAGTRLEYTFHLNKPVARARLVPVSENAGTPIDLLVDPAQPVAQLPLYALGQSQTWKLELADAAGRANKLAPRIEVVVYDNRPARIRVSQPRGDQKVTPLEEVDFAAEIEDDFGLLRYGLTYNVGGGETTTVELGRDAPPNNKHTAAHLLALEALAVKPDQLVNWYFWAEDTGPDGRPRRTLGDMFFAEVKPFEEIFREGQSPAGGQQQQQQQQNKSPNKQTQELVKLQKQIINATWNQMRAPHSDPAALATVLQSQEEALSKAKVLLDKSSDEKTHEHVKAVAEHMTTAVKRLGAAEEEGKGLAPALAAEQAAYQALLKLQAHEHKVTRQQRNNQSSPNGQNQGGQRAQQQLNQLDLRQKENRYETERQAAKLQEPKQREQLQALSRLKDLARRQQDFNEKLKELENALRAAKTEQEKETIRRQLKRLRNEQRQNMADLDELNQRMERPQNRADMKQERKQLQQARQEMTRAAEQMRQGQISQAVASGTRAQKDLQKTRDDLRKKTSSQFSEQMKQMRRDARELSQKQENLGKKLAEEPDKKQRRTLTEPDDKKQLAGELNQQREKLDGLLKEMKDVVEKSEMAEPLLNRKLYDTFRKAHQDQPDKSLELASGLLKEEGINQRALRDMLQLMNQDSDQQKLLDQLRQGEGRAAAKTLSDRTERKLNDLKKGVEKAAESVLGNEAEALKFAQQELDALREALKKEQQEIGGQPQKTGQRTEDQKTQRAQNREPDKGQSKQSGKSQPQQQQATQPKPGQPNNQEQKNQQGQKVQSGQGQPQPGQKPQPAEQKAKNGQKGARQKTQIERSFSASRQGGNPLTGADNREWTDRLRDVEEAVDVPGVRERLSQVREDLRKINSEFRRHSKAPKWDLVETKLFQPLDEIRQQLAEELAKHESDKALVPIDRDPVPARFSDLVRRYYQRLGEGR